MLLTLVICYWVFSVALGLWAALRVKNTRDFAVAGRHLPFYMVTATVFATWFGSEAVLGIPATFIDGSLRDIVADPFGAALCLILVGVFFAAPLYRMKLLTIGDFYKRRYGRSVEVLTTLAIVLSYLGWVGAQLTALGLVFNVVSDGAISMTAGMWIGAGSILIYTLFGGMWAVAITDLVQMIVIVLGLLYIGGEVSDMVGGVSVVVDHAAAAGKLEFWPEADLKAIIAFMAAACTMMLGSMPQQDVFQRMTSAKDEKTAKRGTLIGGLLYFVIAFVPIYIAYAALIAHPELKDLFNSEDAREIQRILPDLVLGKMPLWAQIMFFGALLSAILSTASGALLAPTATFTENVLRPFVPHMSDRQFLLLLRVVLVSFTAFALLCAWNSTSTMYEMVQNAYNVTLTGAFVPLMAGAFWKRANTQGALFSVVLGIGTWLGANTVAADAMVPPNIIGLFASVIGMVLGSLAPTLIASKGHSIETALGQAQNGAEHKH